MTEGKIADMFTAFAAFRMVIIDKAGRMQARADMLAGCGLDAIAEAEALDARELAAGVEVLTRIADGCQDETIPMSMSEVADG